MSYDENLAARIRALLAERDDVVEKSSRTRARWTSPAGRGARQRSTCTMVRATASRSGPTMSG